MVVIDRWSLTTDLLDFKVVQIVTGRCVVVGADDEVGAESVEVAAVLGIVDVVLEKHFFHPKKRKR